MVYIKLDTKWINMVAEKNVIFVIRPGAGTFKNKSAYNQLESQYKVIYFGNTGGKYDKYPDNWEDNSLVSTNGYHLGGITHLVKEYILKKNIIPETIIVGSRGGQVTIGKIWESIWRGPTIIINAGCLTTKTKIPQYVTPLFITMENDYFTSVNTIGKVKYLFDYYKYDSEVSGYIIHLIKHSHMPNLNSNLINLLNESCNFLINREFNIDNISICTL